MSIQRYLPQSVFDGERLLQQTAVVVENGIIVSLEAPNGEEQVLSGVLAPGYIDIQVNGGGGALFNATPTETALSTMIETHSCFGTTAMLPTLITDSVDKMSLAADTISRVIADKVPGIIGVHFEGPHLSVAKRGVHSTDHIRPISAQEKAIFSRDDLGVKVVTLAPENVSPEDIAFLVQHNVLVCLGHSNATFEVTKRALEAGATGFTHLYNAMSPFTSREPGVVGAALEDQNSWCGIIIDGHHVHPAAAKVALEAKPQGKILLVTDAMSPVGSDETEFELLGHHVTRTGDRLNAATGQLAGSVLDMAGAVKNTVETLDVELGEALRMASLYPAEYLVISNTFGRIAPGYRADFVLLNDDLTVRQTFINGKSVYSGE